MRIHERESRRGIPTIRNVHEHGLRSVQQKVAPKLGKRFLVPKGRNDVAIGREPTSFDLAPLALYS